MICYNMLLLISNAYIIIIILIYKGFAYGIFYNFHLFSPFCVLYSICWNFWVWIFFCGFFLLYFYTQKPAMLHVTGLILSTFFLVFFVSSAKSLYSFFCISQLQPTTKSFFKSDFFLSPLQHPHNDHLHLRQHRQNHHGESLGNWITEHPEGYYK